MATGRQKSTSDIDVLVLGDVTLAEVVVALSPLRQTLGREINPVAMTTDNFLAQLDQCERFAMRVLTEPKVFVTADEHEFAELVKDRPTR